MGDDTGEGHLSQLANAGQGYELDDPNGADYYLGLDPDSLADAFWEIILGKRACVLSIEGEVVTALAGECAVTVDGQPLELGAPDGWQLNDPSEIEIVGETCEGILDGTLSTISVTCPCGVILI